jgi:hypothetical protein
MAGVAHHLLTTSNFFIVSLLLLVATTVQAHGGFYVDAEDINKTKTVSTNTNLELYPQLIEHY